MNLIFIEQMYVTSSVRPEGLAHPLQPEARVQERKVKVAVSEAQGLSVLLQVQVQCVACIK
jgi:hypothetical protein